MTNTDALLVEMKNAAADLGMSASTIGRLAGQGGHFYARLKAGKRVWPETAEKVLATIDDLRRERTTHPPKNEARR